jgi:uncharacterized protein
MVMRARRFLLLASLLSLGLSPIAALGQAQNRSATAQEMPAIPPGGDIPAHFTPNRESYDFVRRELEIPMRDGVHLHTVLIIPKNLNGRAPIMLDRTPYSADGLTRRGGGGPRIEDNLFPTYAELARAGYIIAAQDVRGKYGSEGEYVMNRPVRGPLNPTQVDHPTDTYDTIEWLIHNVPESNGRVGTIGTSYDGFTALMSLVNPHPALRASVPINPMVDVWKGDDWFHNGAFRQEMIGYIYSQTATRGSSENWFLNHRDDYNSFLAYGNVANYAQAMGMDQLPFWTRLTQHPAYDAFWQGQAVDRILARAPLTVPTLLVDSQWDQEDIYGAPAVWRAIKGQANGNAHLAIGPWHHGQANRDAATLGPLSFDGDTGAWFRRNVMIPFLDAHLKEGAPHVDTPTVIAFETGTNQWRRYDDWPRACERGCTAGMQGLYLGANGALSMSAPTATAGYAEYVSDPARPVTYRARPNLSIYSSGSTWSQWLVDDQRFAEARPDVLTFETEPLTQPVRIAGQAVARFFASTSGTDSDWVVKLIDVYPDTVSAHPELGGYELAVAMDILRGRYRDDPAHPTPIPANRPVRYELKLPDASHVFLPGHRIMVQIQSSWFPLYDRNPQTYVPNIFFARPQDYRAATQRVYFSASQPSAVWLPVVR